VRGELDISAISIHAYASWRAVCAAATGASMATVMSDARGETQDYTQEIGKNKNRCARHHDSAFSCVAALARQSAKDLNFVAVPFDQIFQRFASARLTWLGLIIHEANSLITMKAWCAAKIGCLVESRKQRLTAALGRNVIHKRFEPAVRRSISEF